MKIAALDSETLGLAPESIVYQIGVVLLDTETSETSQHGFYINLVEQIFNGRTIDPKTISFHKNRLLNLEQFAAEIEPSERYIETSIANAYAKIKPLLDNVDQIWINGLSFDPVLMDNLFAAIGKGRPWFFRKEIDVRTINEHVLPVFAVQEKKGKSLHDALSDAEWNITVAKKFHKHMQEVSTMIAAISQEAKND